MLDELNSISQANAAPGIVVAAGSRCVVENNDWGAAGVPHKQSIHSRLSDGSPLCGWQWEYPELPEGRVLAFPEVIFGKKPWASTSTNPLLPKQLKDCENLTVEFGIRSEATGVYNTALDMWLTRTSKAEPEARVELMVWLQSQGDCHPAGDLVGDEPLYQIWCGMTAEGVEILTYVSKALFTDGIIPLGKMLRDAWDRYYIPRDYYLASVELGNEIWCDKGRAVVDRFDVRP